MNNKKNNQKIRANKIKEKYRLIMKKNSNSFLEKSIKDKNIEQNLRKGIEEEEEKNEIICFYCRDKIEFNTWNKPYGKTGLIIFDYFYSNSIKASLNREIKKINKTNKTINYEDFFWKNKTFDKKGRIVSCGHYFHYECIKTINNNFSCPLCLKPQNIVIPPLNILKKECKYDFLKGEKIEFLENLNKKEKSPINIDSSLNLFFSYVIEFLEKTNLLKIEKDISIIDLFYQEYKSHFSFLENIFYSEGTTFNKRQQIDNLQNIILSFRYLLKVTQLQMEGLKKFIKDNLYLLLNDSRESNILENFKKMHYVNILEKILLSLSIIFDYEELNQTFLYLIYIFLPYLSFGNYFKYLFINDINLDKINIDNFNKFVINRNDELIDIFEIFLKKLTLIKIITDYNNKNEDIIEKFNELSIEQILSTLNLDNLYVLLKLDNNKINFWDIFHFLPKLFNCNDILFKDYKNNFSNDIFNIIIRNININIQKNNNKKECLTKELLINFSPIKFEFIKFDNKVFDWIEKNVEKKCIICSKHSKYNYICLICGDKVCHTNECNQFRKHAEECNGNNSIFIDMDDMKICISVKLRFISYIFPLYLNENGIGPNGYEMENKFILSNENLNLALKNFVSYDFFFK